MKSRLLATVLCVGLSLGGASAAEQETKAAARAVSENPTPLAGESFDESELAELSQREEAPAPEVAGGALSNLHLTYIVIALAAAVVVLIAK